MRQTSDTRFLQNIDRWSTVLTKILFRESITKYYKTYDSNIANQNSTKHGKHADPWYHSNEDKKITVYSIIPISPLM